MATHLGDAAIRIALDPRLAKDELDRLSQEIERIDQAKAQQQRELTELNKQAKTTGEAAKRASGKTGAAGGGVIGTIKEIIDQVVGPLQAGAAVGEYVLPKLGTALESGLAGTLFEETGKMVNSKIQAFADQITEIRAFIDSVKPFAEQAVQFNIASLRLGGRFPADQAELMKQLWQITNQQELLRRNLNRDIDNQTVDQIFKGAKAFMSGGK